MGTYTFREYGQDRIKIYEINGGINLKAPIRAHNYHLILIRSGEITVDINFRVFDMKPHSTLHISSGEIIKQLYVSKEIYGFHIVFSPGFQTEIRTTRKSPISIQLKKEFPYQEFSDTEYSFLESSVSKLIRYIKDTGHHYQPIVIKNEVHNLLLDISDKRRKEHTGLNTNAGHQEMIRERFRNLVEGNSDRQHNVNWYAEAMRISPDYLSKIIREYDGTSARVWINRAIIRKAEFLMRQSDLTLKEISSRLNFPDQSGFGRFFKSNTGKSPKEFRQELYDQEGSSLPLQSE